MIDPSEALRDIPEGLRSSLVREFIRISENYAEHRWGPSELSGGLFCEIVYTILDGHAKGSYSTRPFKPSNFIGSCRSLENNTHVPRSFRILIPRILPALYEIRNNRGVGHVGGDVDPNPMDASAVLSMASWVMAELVRVFHDLETEDAQRVVDALSERPMPLIWSGDNTKLILDRSLTLRYQILLLLSSCSEPVAFRTLQKWLKYRNAAYLKKLITEMDDDRMIHRSDNDEIHLLPPGSKAVRELLATS